MGYHGWLEFFLLGLAVAALIPIPHMVWGRPNVEIEFTRDEQGNLSCGVYNRPISNRFLVRLRVRRDATCITVGILVQNADTGGVVLGATIPLVKIHDQLVSLDKIDLPSGHSPLSAMLVQISGAGAGVYTSNGVRIHLPTGTYKMEITVLAGEHRPKKQRNFVVTADPRQTYWADN